MNTLFKPILFLILFLFSNSIILKAQEVSAQTDEFAKKKVETKLMEVVIPPDSIDQAELVKRGVNWMKLESKTYFKTAATSTSGKVECIVSFPVKPKDLNPEVDYTGKIMMKVLIECKPGKYKYTVNEIKHVSKKVQTNGGSIDNKVPECGSMAMNDLVWKKLKGEALRGASQVVADLKVGMLYDSGNTPADEW
jgi:hypothetical protein